MARCRKPHQMKRANGTGSVNKLSEDGKSSKHKKAEAYILKGQDLEIIPESVFIEMLEQ